MRLNSVFLAGLLLSTAAPAVAQTTAAPAQSLEQLAPEIDALFAKFQADAHVPGLVYGVIKDGKLAYVKGAGVQNLAEKRAVTPDTLFRIASMTKAFTALSILKLRDDGKLLLDDLAEKHVPEMEGWRYPTADSPRIRVRDLLQHVGGFVTDDPWGDRQQVLPEAEFTKMIKAGVPFSRTPQMAHEYSNLGYALLGRIVTNVSGMPYRRYVEKTLLKPLGMTASGFEVTDAPKERRAIGYRWENDAWAEEPTMKDGAFNAMGGLQVSANDYAKWVAFLLSAWPPRDGADNGPVKTCHRARNGAGAEFCHARDPNGGKRRDRLQTGCCLRNGLARRTRLRPRPHDGAWRRISGLWQPHHADARIWRRRIRNGQPHLCRAERASLGQRGGDAQGGIAEKTRGAGFGAAVGNARGSAEGVCGGKSWASEWQIGFELLDGPFSGKLGEGDRQIQGANRRMRDGRFA